MTNIGGAAFENCSSLTNVTCYATIPPTIVDDGQYPTFSSYLARLLVPCESLDAYDFHPIWGKFKRVECIPEETDIEEITALPMDIDANGIRYNVLGQPVGEDYKGIVIVNGRKYLVK